MTDLRAERVRVHLDAELAMPFVPANIVAYLSLDLVFMPAPFILRSRPDLQALALRSHVVPSLHVALGCIYPATYGTHSGMGGKLSLAGGAIVISLSTLLTHQHHLLDVITGLILAAACKHFIYDCWWKRSFPVRTSPASPTAGPSPTA